MKIPKEAAQLARALFRASLTNGRLDRAKVTASVAQLLERKPRHAAAALKHFQRLVRLELAKRHATLQSAASLTPALTKKLETTLRTRYGSDITTHFTKTPTLIAGLRIQLGSDVWDSSVQGRLERLAAALER